MARILVPLAPGCEELEAVTIIDLLRRAGMDVTSAGLAEGTVTASRGTVLLPDMTLDEALQTDYDMIVLPGGQPGADNLAADTRIIRLLQDMAANAKYTAAICAAPLVLARAGLLDHRRVTAYPGSLEVQSLPETTLLEDSVVRDGHVITAKGPGAAMDFALELIQILLGEAQRQKVESALQRP